jgi:hypothetical protein
MSDPVTPRRRGRPPSPKSARQRNTEKVARYREKVRNRKLAEEEEWRLKLAREKLMLGISKILDPDGDHDRVAKLRELIKWREHLGPASSADAARTLEALADRVMYYAAELRRPPDVQTADAGLPVLALPEDRGRPSASIPGGAAAPGAG